MHIQLYSLNKPLIISNGSRIISCILYNLLYTHIYYKLHPLSVTWCISSILTPKFIAFQSLFTLGYSLRFFILSFKSFHKKYMWSQSQWNQETKTRKSLWVGRQSPTTITCLPQIFCASLIRKVLKGQQAFQNMLFHINSHIFLWSINVFIAISHKMPKSVVVI